MIHRMWNSSFSGTTASPSERPSARDAAQSGVLTRLFRDRTPKDWHVDLQGCETVQGLDAILTLAPTADTHIRIAVKATSTVEPRDVPRLIDQLRLLSEDGPHLVVAPYLSPRTQGVLTERGMNFADLTGNMLFALDEPFIYIRTQGASADPWRENRSVHSLKGPAAGRVVRALCDFRPPYGIRELSARATIPAASVSRIVQLLEREALVVRGKAGEVVDVHWKELIRRWVEDYTFSGSNRVFNYFDPRGPQNLIERLRRTETRYAITGSFAAAQVAPLAPPRLATIYTEQSNDLARETGLQSVESGMNVVLARPFHPVVFDRTWTKDGRTYAALSQVAPDLMTGPGRAPSEAEELLRLDGRARRCLAGMTRSPSERGAHCLTCWISSGRIDVRLSSSGRRLIYFHIGESVLPVALYTKDVDLAIDPDGLAAEPKITLLLESSGFVNDKDWPGNWSRNDRLERADFIVPATRVKTGRRSAHLPTQGNKLANFAPGLEGALVDNEVKAVAALEEGDPRRFEIAVAGPAALLIAKGWKLGERDDKGGDRLLAKDALDVLFILRVIEVPDLVLGLRRQLRDEISRQAAVRGLDYLKRLFGDESAAGSTLAAHALYGIEDELSVRRSCTYLARELLREVDF